MNMLIDEEKIAAARARADSMPLDRIDVTHFDLFRDDTVGAYLKRLRRDDPVHWHEDSHHGPFWSVTRFDDIEGSADLFVHDSAGGCGRMARRAAQRRLVAFASGATKSWGRNRPPCGALGMRSPPRCASLT